MSAEGRRIQVRGTVQGVGFRPWVWRLATGLGVTGAVKNGAAGVTIDAFGETGVLDRLLGHLMSEAPPAARVSEVSWRPIPAEARPGFVIEHSEHGGAVRAAIPPDLATCPTCLAEVGDPGDRRHGYAFTNCTDCGPRFTIALGVPYDRPATTMAPFEMCPACRAEYEDPASRRFHAQPNACPTCGPTLEVRSAAGAPVVWAEPLWTAARALESGRIVGVKGLGGYHLACDATDEAAVKTLRRRKHREEKPFAVMVATVADAEALAEVDAAERALLESPARPIVLCRTRPGAALAPSVAPDSARVGLMLPYTPLHHLLLREVGRPLVMTSGNLSDAPTVFRDDDALTELAPVVDLFLLHDREIAARADDSVAMVIGGTPTVMRRSRGYVPAPIRLAREVARPILAVGGQLKNTFCLAAGDQAILGPHIGDLDSLEAFESFQDQIGRLARFLGLEPEVVAHDLHPGYLSTRHAEGQAGLVRVPVQHHHAHVMSCMAEHHLEGEVLGVAYDGTGAGDDGTAWGGELLLASAEGYRRLATFRPIRLAGGEQAIREPWRLALSLLDDAYDGAPPLDALALFDLLPPKSVQAVRSVLADGAYTVESHGVGRYFDALASLGLVRPRAAYEGQLALAWDQVADPAETGRYLFALDLTTDPWTVDLRPLVRQAVSDLLSGRGAAVVSARFHETLAHATVGLVEAAAERHGFRPVVLTGGCFQNPRLAVSVARSLQGDGLQVFRHGEVPPGDGGLALGQVLVADAVVRRAPHAKE